MKIIVLLLISFSVSLSAREGVSKVIKLRGSATVLIPGKLKATQLEMGQMLPQDSSILTTKKSFVRVQNLDGSTISIGPESKLVISRLNREGDGLIKLLKGKIRSHVVPSNSGERKLFLKTATASMGVRGTEFETLYHPENKVTTLLTYKGEVAIKISDNEELHKKESVDQQDINKIDDGLRKESVVVKRGQFSQTVATLKTTSQPVVISPVQLNSLYRNDEFKVKKEKAVRGADLEQEQLEIQPISQEVPPEGIMRDGVYAQKAGGFIDRETGLYVPPSEDAVFDERSGVYLAQNIGAVDSETGQYKAPIGLKLDATKGFVSKKLKKGAPSELVRKIATMKKKLNGNLDSKVVIGDLKKGDITWRPFGQRELFAKNSMQVSIYGNSYEYELESDSRVGGGAFFESESSSTIELKGNLKATRLMRPFVIYRQSSIDLDGNDLGSYTQGTESLSHFGLGLDYSLSSRWMLTTEFLMYQELLLHHTSDNSSFIRANIPIFSLGLIGEVIRSKKFALITEFKLQTNLSKSSATLEVDSFGFGVLAKLTGRYWLTKKWAFDGHLNLSQKQLDYSGSDVTYNSTMIIKNSSLGVSLFTHF